MLRLARYLQKKLIWAIPIALGLGLLCGGFLFDARVLRPLIMPLTFLMIYPMMTSLDLRSVLGKQGVGLQLLALAINFTLIPCLAFLIGKLMLSGGEKQGLWAVGLFLGGVLPTSGMTISWTGFAGGNKEAATRMVVFGLLAGALAAPLYTKLFLGAVVDVDLPFMFRQIAVFVIAPLIAGALTQWWLRRSKGEQAWRERFKPSFPPFSSLGVVAIAFLAMALKARGLLAHPEDILRLLAPIVVFYAVAYLLLSIIGRLLLPRRDAVALVFGVVMRNLSIALAIAMTAFGPEGSTIALLIALAYVVQIQSAAWYVRLFNRFWPPPTTD